MAPSQVTAGMKGSGPVGVFHMIRIEMNFMRAMSSLMNQSIVLNRNGQAYDYPRTLLT